MSSRSFMSRSAAGGTMLLFVATGIPQTTTSTGTVCGVTISPGHATGFESSDAGWSLGYGWTRNFMDANSGSVSLMRIAGGSALTTTATTPALGVPANSPTLSFAYQFTTTLSNWDAVSVRIVVQQEGSGESQLIGTLEPGYANADWIPTAYSLAAWAERTVRVRFVWEDSSYGYGENLYGDRGFFLDDLVIDSTGASAGTDSVEPTGYFPPDDSTYSGLASRGVSLQAQDDVAGIYGYSYDVVTNTGASGPDACVDVRSFKPGDATALANVPSSVFGTYTVRARPVDWNGNVGSAAWYSFNVDRVPPMENFISPADGSTTTDHRESIIVRYKDEDVVGGIKKDEGSLLTWVDPGSVRLLVDGVDVMARDRETCANLEDALHPVSLGPLVDGLINETWETAWGTIYVTYGAAYDLYENKVKDAYANVHEAVFGVLTGGPTVIEVAGVRVTIFLAWAPAIQQLFEELEGVTANPIPSAPPLPPTPDPPSGTVVDQVVDSVANTILNELCSPADIDKDHFQYTPAEPWAPGGHDVEVRFLDTALGMPNERIVQWEFFVA